MVRCAHAAAAFAFATTRVASVHMARLVGRVKRAFDHTRIFRRYDSPQHTHDHSVDALHAHACRLHCGGPQSATGKRTADDSMDMEAETEAKRLKELQEESSGEELEVDE